MTTTQLPTCEICGGTGEDLAFAAGDEDTTCQVCKGTGHAEPIGRTRGLMEAARFQSGQRAEGTGPRPSSSPSPAASGSVRWRKVGEAWGISGPPEVIVPGAEVSVANRKGEVKTVTVGRIVEVANRYGDTVALLAAEAVEGSTSEGPAYRWVKNGDDWFVAGPRAEVGTEITVTKKGGETAQVVVSSVWITDDRGRQLHRVSRAQPTTTTPGAPDIDAGQVWVTTDGEPVRTHRSKDGNLYGKVWDRLTETWEYAPGIIGSLDHRITAEEAAEWGHHEQRCIFCSTPLSDDGTGRSIERGYGPTCAVNHGLPWG